MNAGSIDAVLTLNAKSFQDGLTKSTTAVENCFKGKQFYIKPFRNVFYKNFQLRI